MNDDDYLHAFYFAFGHLREAMWRVSPMMKYMMLAAERRN